MNPKFFSHFVSCKTFSAVAAAITGHLEYVEKQYLAATLAPQLYAQQESYAKVSAMLSKQVNDISSSSSSSSSLPSLHVGIVSVYSTMARAPFVKVSLENEPHSGKQTTTGSSSKNNGDFGFADQDFEYASSSFSTASSALIKIVVMDKSSPMDTHIGDVLLPISQLSHDCLLHDLWFRLVSVIPPSHHRHRHRH